MNTEHFAAFIVGVTVGYIGGIITESPITTAFGFIIGAIVVFAFFVKNDN